MISNHHTAGRGFTLIELLVVIVIMGIVLGMVSINLMPDDRSLLRDEAKKLALIIENASLDARSSGQTMAWSVYNNGYAFWHKNEYDNWEVITDDRMLRARSFPEGMAITAIHVEQQSIEREDKLALTASVLPLPYQIQLSYRQQNIYVISHSTGSVTVNWEAKLNGD